MKIFAIFFIFTTATQSENNDKATLPIKDRLALLKYELLQEIGKEKFDGDRLKNDENPSFENIEYDDIENQPITPINENDERKQHGRFLLRQLKTTTDTPWTPQPTKTKKNKNTKKVTNAKSIEIKADDLKTSSEEQIPKLQGIDKILDTPNKTEKTLRNEKLLPVNLPDNLSDIFYRRLYDLNSLKKHCPKEMIHCITLITPLLTGQKTDLSVKKVLTYQDHEVTKLLQLFSEDTTDMTKEEIYSTLYQISNTQIRLFQWNIASLKLLFKVITKETTQHHTWRSLKRGVKRMLYSWHLDFTNVTNLLRQARLFRPPCIKSDQASSTLSSRPVLYSTKKIKPKCSETEDSGSCERF